MNQNKHLIVPKLKQEVLFRITEGQTSKALSSSRCKFKRRLQASLGDPSQQKLKVLLLGVFYALSSEYSPTDSFFHDLINNNLMHADDEESSIRRLIRKKVYDMILNYREEYDRKKILFREHSKNIREWNTHRNRISVDFNQHERDLLSSEVYQNQAVRDNRKEMKELCNLIHRSTEFIQQPLGPIGTCINAFGDWLPIVEQILRPFANIFLVDNAHDACILQKQIDGIFGDFVPLWLGDYSQRPCVWIIKFSIRDVIMEPEASDYLTLLNVVHIRNRVVKKFLQTQVPMARILMFKTQHEAFPVLSDRQSIPKGTFCAYTRDFYKVYPHPIFKSLKLEKTMDPGEAYLPKFNLPVILQKLKLEKERTGLGKMETQIRSWKKRQLEMMESLENTRKKIERLQKGLTVLKSIPWHHVQAAVECLMYAESRTEMQRIIEVETMKMNIMRKKHNSGGFCCKKAHYFKEEGQ